MEDKEVIQIWKDKKISYAEFVYSCGGDSMGNTELIFYGKSGDEVSAGDELEAHFDDVVYDNVNFYVNSDGHYMGESGVIHIELEDDCFTYSKNAQAEWSESIDTTLEFELTNEQAEFIRNNISELSGGEGEFTSFNYSRDFILTDEDEDIEKEIGELIDNKCSGFEPDVKHELQDWYNYRAEDIEVGSDNILSVTITNSMYVYTESED